MKTDEEERRLEVSFQKGGAYISHIGVSISRFGTPHRRPFKVVYIPTWLTDVDRRPLNLAKTQLCRQGSCRLHATTIVAAIVFHGK